VGPIQRTTGEPNQVLSAENHHSRAGSWKTG